MSEPEKPPIAWEPVTPRGVASFAHASFERLWVVQSIFALLCAAAAVWFLSACVFRVADGAIRRLPAAGSLHGGRLDWRGDSPVLLAEGRRVSLSVDLAHDARVRCGADFQVEFGRDSLVVISLLGEAEYRYPRGWTLPAGYADARPAWDAWSPNLLGLAAIAVFFGLLALWAAVAALYCGPVWVLCYFAGRDLPPAAAWRLGGAALMPGALLMCVLLVCYGLGAVDLVQFALGAVLHVVAGWVCLLLAPLFLPRAAPAAGGNPFKSGR